MTDQQSKKTDQQFMKTDQQSKKTDQQFMMNDQQLKEIFEKYECDDFKFIDPASIVTARWVRMKCRFGCPEFGKCLVCPPNLPSVDECREFFGEYRRAVIFHFSAQLDDPDARHAWSKDINKRLLKVEREVFLGNNYKAFVLFIDPCNLCDQCIGLGADCRIPKEARPSGEGFAMDVYATARAAGYEIDVVQEKTDRMNRYGFLMIE